MQATAKAQTVNELEQAFEQARRDWREAMDRGDTETQNATFERSGELHREIMWFKWGKRI